MSGDLGVVFPHGEVEPDPVALARYARGIEELGFGHALLYEHVLGAGLAGRPQWSGPYSADDPFHEPFVLFGYWAALTSRLVFVTGVMVLPQRQTALVAKQAAQVALVSGGRLRLGVGLGWNEVEYDALGVPFARRGDRMEEQLAVLRRLWAEHTTTVGPSSGFGFHTIDDAGINPRPSSAPPVWIGCGAAARAIDRVARVADGWIPSFRSAADCRPTYLALGERLEAHGRDLTDLAVVGRVIGRGSEDADWARSIGSWYDLGATHVAVNVAGMGHEGVDAHLRALEALLASLPAELRPQGVGPEGPLAAEQSVRPEGTSARPETMWSVNP